MKAEEALLAIQEAMDGTEWDSGTTEVIAQIMVQAGYRIRDLDDEDHDEIQKQTYNKAVDVVIESMLQDAGLHGIGVVHISKTEMTQEAAKAADIPVINMPLAKPDHERIWLQHPDWADPEYGRLWCENKVWPEEDEEGEPTEYVRADILKVVSQTLAISGAREVMLKSVLKELVSDITSMRMENNPYGFGPFGDYYENIPMDPREDAGAMISWPNLAITIKKAEALLKELGT